MEWDHRFAEVARQPVFYVNLQVITIISALCICFGSTQLPLLLTAESFDGPSNESRNLSKVAEWVSFALAMGWKWWTRFQFICCLGQKRSQDKDVKWKWIPRQLMNTNKALLIDFQFDFANYWATTSPHTRPSRGPWSGGIVLGIFYDPVCGLVVGIAWRAFRLNSDSNSASGLICLWTETKF